MTAKAQKQQPTVKLTLTPGVVSEHQKKLWRSLWTRLISECQRELKAEQEAKREQ